ncbi:MAG: AAA family ATPase [Rhizomicrobium sp.]
MKDIVLIGGANGAGKTTAAQDLLSRDVGIVEFVNADEIARGLSPFAPQNQTVASGRAMLERIRAHVRGSISFAFETTLSGRTYAPILSACKKDGWRVTLLYLWLPSPAAAIDRVARRVRQGGHAVPDNVVVRRYSAGLRNLHHVYLPLADMAQIYDNSDGGRSLVAEKMPDMPLAIRDAIRWEKILSAGQ